jgi:hypothetical protein
VARQNALKAALALKRWDAALEMAEALAAGHPSDAGLADQVVQLKALRATPPRR